MTTEDKVGPSDRRLVFFDGDVTKASIAELRGQLIDHHNQDAGATVTIVINSVGGSVIHALGFVNFVRHLMRLRIDTICTCTASSAAVPLFMLGKERLLAPDAYMVLHQAANIVDGTQPMDTRAFESHAAHVRHIDETYSRVVSAAAGKLTPSAVLDLMKKDTTVHAKRAIKIGLATGMLKAPRRH